MIIGIRSLVAIMLLLTMQFAGVVQGQYPGVVGEGGVSVDGIFYGEGCAVAAKDNNLLLGGIGQVGDPALPPNSDFLVELNPEYKKLANEYKAVYVPTYYTGNTIEDAANVDLAATSEATNINGLESPVLRDKQYNTIIAYSGGTATAVEAIDKQGVKCTSLILISPMKGVSVNQDDYEKKIKHMLESGAVQYIVVIQSKDDKLPFDDLYAASFEEGKIPGVAVINVDLETKDIQAHKDLFFVYAEDHLRLGRNGRVYYTSQSISQKSSSVLSNTKSAQPGIGSPMLSPSTSDTSGFSAQSKDGTDIQNKDGTDVPESSGESYFDEANDVWYIDAYHWSGDRDLYSKPAAPRHFVSGELNTYGYNWVYLPFEQTGMIYNQGYYDWCGETLASIGQPSPTAGYGVLVDEGMNSGGSW